MDLRFFEIYRSGEYLGLILGGALTSLGLTIVAGIAGFVLAFLLAFLRFKQIPVLERIAAGYIDFIRNTPLIVQLFFIAFGLPMLLGYVWPFWCHALLALTINFSGYFAEILRSGFASTQRGQLEAAAALNLPNRTVQSGQCLGQCSGFEFAKQDSVWVNHRSSDAHQNVSVTIQSIYLSIFNDWGDIRNRCRRSDPRWPLH